MLKKLSIVQRNGIQTLASSLLFVTCSFLTTPKVTAEILQLPTLRQCLQLRNAANNGSIQARQYINRHPNETRYCIRLLNQYDASQLSSGVQQIGRDATHNADCLYPKHNSRGEAIDSRRVLCRIR